MPATRTAWTARDVPDQTGRTFVVTGANSGLGLATTHALAAAHAHVVMAVRDVGRGETAAAQVDGDVAVRQLDLADLDSVARFAEGVEHVDVLVDNAGIMAVPHGRTAQGFEAQFGTNHLGHFALTGRLLPRLTDRVVVLSSTAHRMGRISLDDPNWERRRYRRWAAYGQSKLANLLFTYEFQRRALGAGSSLRAVAAHPGYASTNLQSHTGTVQDRLMAVTNRLVGQSPEMGALPELYAATVPDVPGGWFFGPGGPFEIGGYPTAVASSPASRDATLARQLWELSERLTGVTYAW